MLPLFQQRNLYNNNMADANKPKLQLRSGLSTNGDDRTPSPATKLLINHGKPNFTIQRLTKAQNGNARVTPPSPPVTNNGQSNNNKEFVVKSTKFNGILKPSNISAITKQTSPLNGNANTKNTIDNEAAKVVLRRTNVVQTHMREVKGDDDDDVNVPEFIRRQRRIQERLANQNILDFENRRSGYFTQVLISPSSPNRQSFVETMASPAVKPGLEIPPPPTPHEDIKEETILQEQEQEQQQQSEFEKSRHDELAESVAFNGHVEEEEVAKAIEEVNKAVEGEDDDKTDIEEPTKLFEHDIEENMKSSIVVSELQNVDELKPESDEKQQEEIAVPTEEGIPAIAAEVTLEQPPQENNNVDATIASVPQIEEHQPNGLLERKQHGNGHLTADNLDNQITISHVNGLNGPCIPAPDPKGEKGVNFEAKTVVSFSQELGNNDNKYPDTVKVLKDVATSKSDSELKELSKLKFEINADNQDIEVKPVLITENI